ncbi:hypothetical protein Atai01_14600 [Amycolatopsis taiwanensis]|uniref:Uncharacterized protein n=1 Tax=Amycolatopsis taiwanensis TaxID=342230 RepID=A0A9W6QVK6_9PSEU|nr:hypothetical protein Atai01_14600 [Amycolatopsis taiwanensis]
MCWQTPRCLDGGNAEEIGGGGVNGIERHRISLNDSIFLGFGRLCRRKGLDHYQVRRYGAWYRHTTLAMLAHTYLAVTAPTASGWGHSARMCNT